MNDLHIMDSIGTSARSDSGRGVRILIYGHDTFGLGHMRRCRAIAHALVRKYRDVSVLILTGSPVVGRFDFLPRVDFVRIPGVIKLSNGDYKPLGLETALEEVITLRENVIYHTARHFRPDLFIVDKEPLGLCSELSRTLPMLRDNGTRLVLGLRDILDDELRLRAEWERKGTLQAVETFYDEIWIYGTSSFYDPLKGFSLPDSVRRRIHYSGYLARRPEPQVSEQQKKPFLLIMAGGGGDGAGLIDLVLCAYERRNRAKLLPAYIVLGPFMEPHQCREFLNRMARLDDVEGVAFDNHIEGQLRDACGIVSMGGYNAFCEILAADKPSLLFPRRAPRLEQYLRVQRAAEVGLVQLFPEIAPAKCNGLSSGAGVYINGKDSGRLSLHSEIVVPPSKAAVDAMVEALAVLPDQPPPSHAMPSHFLDGLEWLTRRLPELLEPLQEDDPGSVGDGADGSRKTTLRAILKA